MIQVIVAAAVGYAAGAFTPSVGRKIKALWVKDSKQAVASAVAGVSSGVGAAVAAEVKKL